MAVMRFRKITTEAGVSLATNRQKMLIRFGAGYVEKEARDIVPGERVRFRKDAIQKTLDEVDVVLSTASERYTDARSTIMERSPSGLWVPKLRTLLVTGLNKEMEFEPRETIEQRLFFEGSDFTPQQYRLMINRVTDEIEKYALEARVNPVCWDTVSEWVMGKTIAPQDKHLFFALAQFNVDFKDIGIQFISQPKGPWAVAYDTYVTIRRVVMSYISRLEEGKKPHSGGKGKKCPEDERLKLGPELSAVVSAFGDEIGRQYIDVEVTATEVRDYKQGKLRKKEREEPHLFKGLARADDIESTGRIEVKRIEDYSDAEIYGTDQPEKNIETAIEHAKLFALRNGFSLSQLKRRLIYGNRGGPRPDDEQIIEAEATQLGKELGISSLEEMAKRILEEATPDVKLEDLTPEQRRTLMEEARKACLDIADHLGREIDETKQLMDAVRHI